MAGRKADSVGAAELIIETRLQPKDLTMLLPETIAALEEAILEC